MNTSDLDHISLAEAHDAGAVEAAPHRMGGLALAIAVAALAAGVLTVLVLDGSSRMIAEKPQDCAVITDADTRLACYDDSVHRAVSQPAHGALAPSPTK
jgi:hypothetical protein